LKTLSHLEYLDLNTAELIIVENNTIEIAPETLEIVRKSFDFLEAFSKNKVIYGINTGFGPMAQYKIDAAKQKDLQYNLIRSHASGAGEKIPDIYVRASMLVRLKAILQGNSAIDPSCIELLKQLLNEKIYPFIPEHGGVGASGDLVQLSHLALVLIGEGEVSYKGKICNTKDIFEQKGLNPIAIKLREGLSLINGT
jgi:histidine ammonia-lyase